MATVGKMPHLNQHNLPWTLEPIYMYETRINKHKYAQPKVIHSIAIHHMKTFQLDFLIKYRFV